MRTALDPWVEREPHTVPLGGARLVGLKWVCCIKCRIRALVHGRGCFGRRRS